MNFQLNNKSITLRPINDADEELLCRIYSSTRTSEMNMMTTWGDLQKEYFLRMQARAQHAYYYHHYEDAFFYIILKKNKPIGRLYLHEKFKDQNIRIVDITLLPEWRGKGIGTSILLQIIIYASEKKQAITLHVASSNPANQLYSRLGFKFIGFNGTHHLMEWKLLQ